MFTDLSFRSNGDFFRLNKTEKNLALYRLKSAESLCMNIVKVLSPEPMVPGMCSDFPVN